MSVPDVLAKGMIAFDGDDSELVRKYFDLEAKTKALGKSIESGLYTAVQRGAMRAAKEFKSLENAVKKQIHEEVYAEEIAAAKKDQVQKKQAAEAEKQRRRQVTEAERALKRKQATEHRMEEQAEKNRQKIRSRSMGFGGETYVRYREEMQRQGLGKFSVTSAFMKTGAVGAGLVYGAAAAAGGGVQDTFSKSAQLLALKASRIMTPALITASSWMQRMADKVDSFTKQNPKLSASLGYVALYGSALAGIGLGARGLAAVYGGLKSTWVAGRSALGAVGLLGTGASLIGMAGGQMAKVAPTAAYAPPGAQIGVPMARPVPTASFAPPGSRVGQIAGAGAGAAGVGTMIKGAAGFAARTTGLGLLGYAGYQALDAVSGGATTDYLSIIGNALIGQSTKGITARQGDRARSERLKSGLMAGKVFDLQQYDVTGYRDAAQNAGLGQSPLDAKIFQEQMDQYNLVMQASATELKQAAEELKQAAGNLNGKGPVAPGVW